MIGEECVLEFFQGLESRGQGPRTQLARPRTSKLS